MGVCLSGGIVSPRKGVGRQGVELNTHGRMISPWLDHRQFTCRGWLRIHSGGWQIIVTIPRPSERDFRLWFVSLLGDGARLEAGGQRKPAHAPIVHIYTL